MILHEYIYIGWKLFIYAYSSAWFRKCNFFLDIHFCVISSLINKTILLDNFVFNKNVEVYNKIAKIQIDLRNHATWSNCVVFAFFRYFVFKMEEITSWWNYLENGLYPFLFMLALSYTSSETIFLPHINI